MTSQGNLDWTEKRRQSPQGKGKKEPPRPNPMPPPPACSGLSVGPELLALQVYHPCPGAWVGQGVGGWGGCRQLFPPLLTPASVQEAVWEL